MRPAPLIRGDDLIAAGYPPGPRFKQILSAVEDGQLEGRLRSKEDAMELVGREFPLQPAQSPDSAELGRRGRAAPGRASRESPLPRSGVSFLT